MTNIRELSWSVVFSWLGLATFGLLAIYSATQGPVSQFLPGYIQSNFFKQAAWVILSIIVMIGIQFVSPRTFIQVSYLAYGLGIILMIATLLIGTEVNGARSWLQIGPARFQTSEFMKILTILATANYLTSRRDISAENIRYALVAVVLVLIPAILVVLQNDFGTGIVYFSLIPVMLFWSGLPYGVSLFIISPAIVGYLSIIEWYYGAIAIVLITGAIFFIQRRAWLTIGSFIVGILTVTGVQVALLQVLKPHQVSRILTFTNPSLDPTGAGWNVIQAKTAVGSGGLTGKGFLEGTQTQLKFLPEMWTDFVYCVIGEEFGFVGAGLVILLFGFLFIRMLTIAGNHKHPFAQLVTVSVAAVLFIHFYVNLGSALSLLPVIGIPLPFVSYGGTSFLSNSIMLAIVLNMDLYKREFSIYR